MLGILRSENRDYGGDSPADITRSAEKWFFIPAVVAYLCSGVLEVAGFHEYSADAFLVGSGLTVFGLVKWIVAQGTVRTGNYWMNPGNEPYTEREYDSRYDA